MLAASLWYRYRPAPTWAWNVWDNTFASLRLKPDMTVNVVSAQDRAFCYADFMLHIDQHLAEGLDPVIANWLVKCGTSELVVIDSEAWDSVIFTLLYLVVHGALTATTVLKHLVYPLWKHALNVFEGPEPANQQPPEVYLRAAHDVFARLLLNTACTPDGIPPNTFIDLQRIATRRQDVFREDPLKDLVSQIPTLVFLEKSRGVSTELGELSGTIRGAVCEVPAFRQGVYRDLNAVRDAFERTLELNTLDEILLDHLMDALRLILNVAKTGTVLNLIRLLPRSDPSC